MLGVPLLAGGLYLFFDHLDSDVIRAQVLLPFGAMMLGGVALVRSAVSG
jgi:hypothetical protein